MYDGADDGAEMHYNGQTLQEKIVTLDDGTSHRMTKDTRLTTLFFGEQPGR